MTQPLCLSRLYTPHENIVGELKLRQQTLGICPTNSLEEILLSRPHAVILRNALTPNFETMRFASLVASLGLRPLVVEYPLDKFVTINAAKMALAVMRFSASPLAAETECQSVRVIDVDQFDRSPFSKIATLGGGALLDFHHQLVQQTALSGQIDHYDASEWFVAQGSKAQFFYEPVFRLFLAHAVMFESYLDKGRDHPFMKTVVIPAFDAAARLHGCKPLVCRLDPLESEGLDSWYHYPTSLYPEVASAAALWAAGGNRKTKALTRTLARDRV
jgi:hypothetical protein